MTEEKIEEETYSLIFSSLKHPIRRRILRMLAAKPLTYSEVLSELKIDSGHLSYHLENLGDLISHLPDNRYALSSFGTAAVRLMSGVEETSPRHYWAEWRPRYTQLMKHKIFLSAWILLTSGIAVNLLFIPPAESRVLNSVLPLLKNSDDHVFRASISMKEPPSFSCEHNITLLLVGDPRGYDVKPELGILIRKNGLNARGIYRFNFTFYYNDQKVYRCRWDHQILEGVGYSPDPDVIFFCSGCRWDHQILEGVGGGECGTVGPSEWGYNGVIFGDWIEWNRYLKTGYNTILMKTTVEVVNTTEMGEFQFGEGELYVEFGPARIVVRSLDSDMDGIPDPIDIPYNNYALLTLFSAMCLPISAGIQFLALKMSKKIGSYWRRLTLKPRSNPALLTKI